MAAPIDRVTDGTHCPYCALQCGMRLDLRGEPTVEALDFPTNKGGLCRKGWTAASLLRSPDRLTTPLLRDRQGGPLRAAPWEEALARITAEFTRIQGEHGADALGIFGGGGLTNEKAYLLGKFARTVLRTRHIDYNGRFCMASAAAANLKAFGMDRGLPFPLEDLAKAEVIWIAGGNPAATMPPIMQYFDQQRAKGGRLIVSDPRRTATARAADLHLQLAPGTDGALAVGLLHVAIRDGLIDRGFIEARTTGFEAVRMAAKSYWPDRVERITGVAEADIVRAAHMLGEAARAIILSARGAEQQVQGVANVLALINLALALGQAGRIGAGYGCLTGQGNGQGRREHGQKADQLPGYRRLDDPAHRAWIAGVWGVDETTLPPPGVSATELLAKLGGEVRALMVLGANPVVSAPNVRELGARLQSLDLLVVLDFFLSETAMLADVVLPVPQWAEEEGTMTNLEGRILYRRKLTEPPAGVRADTLILADLAEHLGRPFPTGGEPRAIFQELARASAGGVADYAGVTYERIIAEDGVFWPCPTVDHPGTKRPFLERFSTPDGKARFHAVHPLPPGETPNAEFPMLVTTGRLLAHYQSGAQTRRVEALAELEPEPVVELHPSIAKTFGIEEGAPVTVTTRRGSAFLKARLTPDIRLDTLFVPFHWGGEGAANLLTQDALDPISKIPEFKVAAGRIQPALRPQGDPDMPTRITTSARYATASNATRRHDMDSIPAFLQGTFRECGRAPGRRRPRAGRAPRW
jgi:assimilatory nitrate reductase catalytic subunit